MIGIAIKLALIFRVLFDMRTQQMNDDQFLRRRVIQHILERLQHVGVVFTRTLRTLLVHVVLLVGLAENTVSMVLRAVIVCWLVIQKVL